MDRRGPGDGPDEPPTLGEAIDLDEYKTMVVRCRRAVVADHGTLKLHKAPVLDEAAFEEVEEPAFELPDVDSEVEAWTDRLRYVRWKKVPDSEVAADGPTARED